MPLLIFNSTKFLPHYGRLTMSTINEYIITFKVRGLNPLQTKFKILQIKPSQSQEVLCHSEVSPSVLLLFRFPFLQIHIFYKNV